jgi:hypothetical protein
MSFGKTFKIFELNILRQSGMAITPQQVGLKNDPIADLQAKNATSLFGNVLNQLGGTSLTNNTALATALTAPVPPTPPADSTDTAAQAKYQQALLTYQSSFQVYNQRFMQLLLNQISNLQLSIRNSAAQSSSSSSSSTNGSSSTTDLGVGGIL